MVEPIVVDPFRKGFGKTVANRISVVGWLDGIDRGDKMAKRHAFLRIGSDVATWIFAEVFRSEKMGEITIHELSIEGVEGIQTMSFAVGVVDGGVERARSDKCAESGNCVSELQAQREVGGGFEISRGELPIDL